MTYQEVQQAEGAVSQARHALEQQSYGGRRDDVWDQALTAYANALRAMWEAQRLYRETRERKEAVV